MPEAFKWKDPKPTGLVLKRRTLSGSSPAACPRYRAEKCHRSGAFCWRNLKSSPRTNKESMG